MKKIIFMCLPIAVLVNSLSYADTVTVKIVNPTDHDFVKTNDVTIRPYGNPPNEILPHATTSSFTITGDRHEPSGHTPSVTYRIRGSSDHWDYFDLNFPFDRNGTVGVPWCISNTLQPVNCVARSTGEKSYTVELVPFNKKQKHK